MPRRDVLVDGGNIYSRSIRPMYVRRHIGMVFQQPKQFELLTYLARNCGTILTRDQLLHM
ncbi:MAG TPA: hypothetical protein VII61_22885 [Ktedonobacteraceae bacterium]